MRTDPATRARIQSEAVVGSFKAAAGTVGVQPPPRPTVKPERAGAMSRILAGIFGESTPKNQLSSQVPLPAKTALYQFHEGDLFTPGTGNYVFDSPHELPMMTIWGHGFERQPNTFNPFQPPQTYANPTVKLNGIGGLVAGQFAHQPLESDGQ